MKCNTLLLLAAILATLVGLFVSLTSTIETSDFYPIYYGSKILLQGDGNVYSTEVSDHLRTTWLPAVNKQAAPVIAYPVPVLLLFSPLILFSATEATFIWIFIAVFGITFCLGKTNIKHAILPLFFFPFFQVLNVQNVSLFWCACSLLALSRNVDGLFRGVILAILPLKPQEGFIIAMHGLYCSRRETRVITAFCISLTVLLSTSFFFSPNWIQGWLNSIQIYREQTYMISFWYLAIIFLLPGIPSFLRVLGLQVLLFPLNDMYRSVPLLYGWSKVNMPARSAMLISFGAFLWYPEYNTPQTLLLCIFLPLLGVVILAQKYLGVFESSPITSRSSN